MSRTAIKERKSPSADTGANLQNLMLWLVFLTGFLSFWPACLDRYLVPRFFFLSLALLIAMVWIWKTRQSGMQWQVMDLLLLGWYGLNLASLGWTFSWSEGIFFAQKTLLLFAGYWFVRRMLIRDTLGTYKTLANITLLVTILVCLMLFFQLTKAFLERSLDNQALYDYATAVFGNKSLAAAFVYFLLIFNLLFVAPIEKMRQRPILLYGILCILLVLILMLQVRTVLLATLIGTVCYAVLKAISNRGFRLKRTKKTGFIVLFTSLCLLLFLFWKGKDHSIAQRLNPLNYLESATANERRFVWYKTELLFPEHFWLGVGDGSWKFWLPSKNIAGGYRLSEKNVVFTRAHNDYLEVRAELGILGFLWFCALFGKAFLIAIWSLRQTRHQQDPEPQSAHSIIVAGAGLVGYCVIQFFDFPRERIEFQLILALLFGLLTHAGRNVKAIQWNMGAAPVRGFEWIIAAGLVFNLLLGWQRMSGEIHNVRLLEAHGQKNWPKVIKESQLAENPFYAYTDAAMPLAWHEGIAYFQLGQFDKATVAFERAYRLNPWSFQVINNYASALVKQREYKAAIPLFEKALTINPQYDEGKFNLSFIYFKLADYVQSDAWLSRVDTIKNPGNDEDRSKNRNTLKQLEEFRKVLKEMRK